MLMTIEDDLWARIRVCAAGSTDQQGDPTDAQVMEFAQGLLEDATEQAEEDLVDLGDQG